jgi:hypothetical protein
VIGEIIDAAPGVDPDVYSSNPIIVADIRGLFEKGEMPPDQRTKEFERATDSAYWRLRSVDQTSIVVAGVAIPAAAD